MPDVGTIKQIIEQFQMEYMLADAPRSGRLHALSDDDRTKIIEYADENPYMSVFCVAQEIGHKRKTVCTQYSHKFCQ